MVYFVFIPAEISAFSVFRVSPVPFVSPRFSGFPVFNPGPELRRLRRIFFSLSFTYQLLLFCWIQHALWSIPAPQPFPPG